MKIFELLNESNRKFTIHFFGDSEDAYDATQTEIHHETGAEVKNGDTLVIPSEKLLALLVLGRLRSQKNMVHFMQLKMESLMMSLLH